MSSIRRIQEELAQQREYCKSLIPEIEASRLVIRSDDTTYVDKVGVYVKTIMRRLDDDVKFEQLAQEYPGLTREDWSACLAFTILRAKGIC